MRKLLTLTVAVATAFAALAFAPSAQATIPAHCTAIFTVAPAQYHTDAQTINLGLGSRTQTFGVKYVVPAGEFNDCPAITTWELEAGDQVNGGGDRNLYVHVSDASPVATVDSRRLDNSDAGNDFQVEFWYVADGSYQTDYSTLLVKRATQWTGFNASPEPVVKGNQISLRGTLLRVNWDSQRYAAYAGRQVQYQNRDASGGAYIVRPMTGWTPEYTDNAGFASGSKRADISRVHRFAYYGNSTSGASASFGDYVRVTP